MKGLSTAALSPKIDFFGLWTRSLAAGTKGTSSLPLLSISGTDSLHLDMLIEFCHSLMAILTWALLLMSSRRPEASLVECLSLCPIGRGTDCSSWFSVRTNFSCTRSRVPTYRKSFDALTAMSKCILRKVNLYLSLLSQGNQRSCLAFTKSLSLVRLRE